MPFKYEIYKTQRVCLVRFKRQITGAPKSKFPDIDNRGCFRPTRFDYDDSTVIGFDRGPVIGVMKSRDVTKTDDDVYVQVLRERIDKNAPLFVTSSDESVMKVGSRDELPKDYAITVRITGVKGDGTALPREAKLRIHYGSANGVVIGELSVWVFSKMSVNLTPHRVTVRDAAGASITSQVDIDAVINMMKTIWRQCGITFKVSAIVPTTETMATAGQVLWGEANKLLAHNLAGTINAYFVDQTDSTVLGFGLSRDFVSNPANGMTNPGIVLADRTTEIVNGTTVVTDRRSDTQFLANDLAHEIGHFLQLEHIDNRSPDSSVPALADDFRDDTWSRRNLMHVYNASDFTSTPPPGSPADVGYGMSPIFTANGNRGCLITFKDLIDQNNAVNHSTDPQYLKARMAANSGSAVY